MTDWLILRCAGAKTLDLAASLNDAGFEAWAPVEGDDPMTPGYTFARLAHLQELIEVARSNLTYRVWDPELQRMVAKGHPYFRPMRSLERPGDWATVSDAKLEPLRRLEIKRKPRGEVQLVPVGSRVRCADSGFEGLDGEVDSVRGKKVTVFFDGLPFPVVLGCWQVTLLVDDRPVVHVNDGSSERAARAA